MKFRKLILSFLAMFLMMSVINAKEVVLYNEEVGNQTLATMQKKWVSNNDRVFVISMIMDGETTKPYKYLYYSNLYSDDDTVKNSTDKRHLKDGEYLKININDLNIDSSKYQDIRLHIDYAANSSGRSLIKQTGLKVYAIDTNNKKHGPFYMDDYDSTGYYKRNGYESYLRGFDLITSNLNDKTSYTIKSLEIIPFGNLPRICDEKKTFAGDWRCQASSFFVKNMKIVGYQNENYKNKNVTYQSINVNNTRIKIAQRIYDLATLKWTPSINMATIRAINGFRLSQNADGTIKYFYKTGQYYYGPAYTQINRLLVEQLYSVLDSNKKMPALYETDENGNQVQSRNTWGDDCSASVSYSVSKYLPLTNMYNTTDFIWDRRKTTILGGLTIRPEAESSETLYTDLYNKYLSNLGSSSLKTNVSNLMNKRLKSNDKRLWLLSYKDDDLFANPVLGYSEMQSTTDKPAIDGSDQLKIYVDNITLPKTKPIELKFKYFIDIGKNGGKLDENLQKSSLIVGFCNASDYCAKATNIEFGKLKTFNSKYKTQEITATYTPKGNIVKVNIIPYGTETKKGRVFRLAEVEIKVDGSSYYKMTASQMRVYFRLNDNHSGGLINSTYVNKINTSFTESETKKLLARFLAEQAVFNGYKELKIGDAVSHHDSKSTHVRLITGNTQVECLDGTKLVTSNTGIASPKGDCISKGGINGARSYMIKTDISSSPAPLTYENRNNFGGFTNSSDYVAQWNPNSKYTDLVAGDIKGVKRTGSSSLFLEGKNLNYNVNTKTSFETSLSTNYVPLTFNDYKTGKVEKPYVTLINGNTTENIKNGLKGSIYSNYPIIKLNIQLEYKKDGKTITKKYEIYPNHSASSREQVFVNNYSLYYNVPENIQSDIKSYLAASSEYKLNVTVDAGTATGMSALKLDTIAKSPSTSVPDTSTVPDDSTASDDSNVSKHTDEPSDEEDIFVGPGESTEQNDNNNTETTKHTETNSETKYDTKRLATISLSILGLTLVVVVLYLIIAKIRLNKKENNTIENYNNNQYNEQNNMNYQDNQMNQNDQMSSNDQMNSNDQNNQTL